MVRPQSLGEGPHASHGDAERPLGVDAVAKLHVGSHGGVAGGLERGNDGGRARREVRTDRGPPCPACSLTPAPAPGRGRRQRAEVEPELVVGPVQDRADLRRHRPAGGRAVRVEDAADETALRAGSGRELGVGRLPVAGPAAGAVGHHEPVSPVAPSRRDTKTFTAASAGVGRRGERALQLLGRHAERQAGGGDPVEREQRDGGHGAGDDAEPPPMRG